MPELLVIKPSSLGDIVHALQAVASIKAQQPGWRVSWIVRDIFAPLVRASTVVDQVFVFQRYEGVRGFLKLMHEVRQRQYDMVFDMQGLLRTGLMTKWAHGRRKVGRQDAREGSSLFYDEKVPLPPGGAQSHAVEVLLQFCTAVKAQPELRGTLSFREMERLNLGFMEPRRGLRPVLMFPDSRREEKKWGGFAQFSSLLVREAGRKVVWAGNAFIPCKEAFPEGAFLNLTGNTSLTSLAAIVAKADWVISNDSGPMHLAAALGVKTLGIFGPTDPRLYGPYPLNRPTNHVIQAPVGDLRLLPARDVFARFRRIEAFGRGETPQSIPPFAHR
ncbi:MAG: glycosyltransferase family 9 protein [Opitutales bacterium]